MDKIKYIHIGYPKCASSALQYSYFSQHPQLYHLGIGCNKQLQYIDDEVNIAVEIDFRFRKEFIYEKEKVANAFVNHFAKANATSRVKSCGISSELISYSWTSDIDPTLKAKRLFGIFGKNTNILMVIRNQKDLLYSLYCEFVKEGYPHNYSEFLQYTYQFKDRSWCYDLCFDKVYSIYADLFGEEHIKVVPFELIKESTKKFTDAISYSLGIDCPKFQLEIHNEKYSKKALAYMRCFNSHVIRSLNRNLYEPNSLTRYKPYFTNELGIRPPTYMEVDRNIRKVIKREVDNLEQNENMQVNISSYFQDEIPKELVDFFRTLYSESNLKLRKYVDVDLVNLGYW